jgi:DNA helicase II / ATP-dependent DNA helicase PcrA
LFLSAAKDVGLKKQKAPSIFFKEAKSKKLPNANSIPARAGYNPLRERFLVTGYSSLEYYLTCPYRYQLIIEYGLTFPSSIYFQFGKLVHDIFAHINHSKISGKELSLTEVHEYYDANFDKYYKNTNMRAYDLRLQRYRGVKIIDKYITARKSWIKNIAFVEHDFTYVTANALIRGRFDALVKNKRNKYSIVDYKTGKPHEGLRTDFQMQFYSLAAISQLGLNVDEAILYYVEDDNAISFEVTKKYLTEGTRNLDYTISGILAEKYPPSPQKGVCKQCEARKLCSFKI